MGRVDPDDSDELLGTVTLCREGSPWREIAAARRGRVPDAGGGPQARGARASARRWSGSCLDRFREEGAAAIVLSTLPQMTAAHRLYERLGFAAAPERDWQPVAGTSS